MGKVRIKKGSFLVLAAACALPYVGTPVALLAGMLFSIGVGNPWPGASARWSKLLLQLSVVGLGFGLSLGEVWVAGRQAVLYTLVGICFTLLLGRVLGRWFGVEEDAATLISFGTAICGGSAIAAMAPVLEAKDEEIAVALATVFTLNAAALLLFPAVGHFLSMDERSFGIWAALAIHDTSSVVGAAAAYGGSALAVGTTVKLARAVWILPCAMVAARLKRSPKTFPLPLFILGFLGAAALRTFFPSVDPLWFLLADLAKRALVVTLFLIGAGFTRQVLSEVGLRPLALGVTLWMIVSSLTLTAILQGWIR
jgi:uncharacterized integral membrane protein (TIGR00698 family)